MQFLRRLILHFYAVVIVISLSTPLSARAEEPTHLAIAPELSKQLLQSNSIDQSLTIALPGRETSSQLVFRSASRKDLTVKLLGASGEVTGERAIPVFEVTDFRSIRGVATISESGIYALLADRSAADFLFWELSPDADSATASANHRISLIRESDLPKELSLRHDMLKVPSGAVPMPAMRQDPTVQAATAQHVIQLIGVSPSVFTAGRGTDQVVAQLVAAVAGANEFFVPLNLTIDLVGVQAIPNAIIDPYLNEQQSQDAEGMLFELQNQWGSRTTPEHDVAAVFGRGPFQGVLGVAFFESSCLFPQYSLLFTTLVDESGAAVVALSATLAHEMGHVIGMDHDSNLYSGQTSLMFPSYDPNVGGFSALSTNQYLAWAGPGKAGGACLQEVGGGDDGGGDDDGGGGDDGGGTGGGGGGSIGTGSVIEFYGGPDQVLKVKEGESLFHQLQIKGALTGVSYSVSGLPEGATFDTDTRRLSYSPGFGVANSRKPVTVFRVLIRASTSSAVGNVMFRVTVSDVNRPPFFTQPLSDTIDATPGSLVDFTVRATDFDKKDRAELTLISAAKVQKRLGKRARITQKPSSIRIRWPVPTTASGEYRLRFRAIDQAGEKTVKTIVLRVGM